MRTKNNSGIILVLVLWILVILSMLTIGIARRTGIELTLTKHGIGKLKSKYVVVGGIVYVIEKIIEDSRSQVTANNDTLYQCGVDLEEKTPEDLFHDVAVGEGQFDIYYRDAVSGEKHYGLQDEEGRINLNALSSEPELYLVLEHLILVLGYDEETAKTVAASVVDWRDENDDVFQRPYGAEEAYYSVLPDPYPCKNRTFDSMTELMLVRGVTPDIYNRIKNYVTIFPKAGPFKVNLDTAPLPVLKALARSWTGPKTNTGIGEADSLAEKIVAYRWGDDSLEGTRDDRVIDTVSMGLTPTEMILSLLIENQRTFKSDYLRAHVVGKDIGSSISTEVSAVVKRSNLSIVEWQRK